MMDETHGASVHELLSDAPGPWEDEADERLARYMESRPLRQSTERLIERLNLELGTPNMEVSPYAVVAAGGMCRDALRDVAAAMDSLGQYCRSVMPAVTQLLDVAVSSECAREWQEWQEFDEARRGRRRANRRRNRLRRKRRARAR